MIRIPSLYKDLSARMAELRSGHEAVDKSRQIVLRALQDGNAHYGINTGFGILANKRISDEQLSELQQNILLSHACGVGDPVPPEITRLMLQLKIADQDDFAQVVREQTGERYEDYKEEVKNGILTQRVLQTEVGARVVIPREEIVAWIKANIDFSQYQNKMQAMGPVMKHFGKLAPSYSCQGSSF